MRANLHAAPLLSAFLLRAMQRGGRPSTRRSARSRGGAAAAGASASAVSASASSSSSAARSPTQPSWIGPDFVAAGVPHWSHAEDYPDVVSGSRRPLPTRDDERDGDGDGGSLTFPDHPEFRPNLTPQQVLRAGSFGGTYYRPIASATAKKSFGKGVHLEFPPEWHRNLDVDALVVSETYRKGANKYGVKSGNDLAFWEGKGWMREQDPYGWFQWYCRFYLGRRTVDDERQVSRWVRAIGPKGRWRTFLVGQCVKAGKAWDDVTASPVTRQTLLHWGYELTEDEFDRLAPPIKGGKSVIYMGKVTSKEGEGAETKKRRRKR